MISMIGNKKFKIFYSLWSLEEFLNSQLIKKKPAQIEAPLLKIVPKIFFLEFWNLLCCLSQGCISFMEVFTLHLNELTAIST